jgi:hypothetical protein
MKLAADEYKACLFIKLSRNDIFGTLKQDLHNSNLLGQDVYPKTLEGSLNLMQNHKSGTTKKQLERTSVDAGVAFAQPGRNPHAHLDCRNCNKKGHIARNCPDLNDDEKAKLNQRVKEGTANANVAEENPEECIEGVANLNVDDDASIETVDSIVDAIGCIQPSTASRSSKKICDPNYLYLDSCATQHSMVSTKFLNRRHTTGVSLRTHCNAGSKMTNKQGYWMDFKFWENEGGLANLLSIPQLEADGYEVSKSRGEWSVSGRDGTLITFAIDSGVCRGMPYIDMTNPEQHFYNPSDGLAMIETVRGNYEGFTREQVVGATEARKALALMAHPTSDRLNHVVSFTNAIKNCPISSSDLANANALFGPDRGGVRGKTVRKKPAKVRPVLISIPQSLFEKLQDVTLEADVMFVNGLPFFVTISRVIKFGTCELLPSQTATQLCSSLTKVIILYRRRNFRVNFCLMDMQFEPLEAMMSETTINTTAAREHVSGVERFIRTIKDRTRSTVGELPYQECMPDAMLVRLLYFVIMWINGFPSESGASSTFSPREIVTGLKLDYDKHCKYLWGSYVEASEDADITNTMRARTSPCMS